MRYCGHFLIKAEGGAKNYKRDHHLPLAWPSFTVAFMQRRGKHVISHLSDQGMNAAICNPCVRSMLLFSSRTLIREPGMRLVRSLSNDHLSPDQFRRISVDDLWQWMVCGSGWFVAVVMASGCGAGGSNKVAEGKPCISLAYKK